MESNLTINDVAKRTGLSAHTLRYYERIGLIAPIGRATGGQRRYAASDIAWIDFLLRLRSTGMSIGQMHGFATLRSAGDVTVPTRRKLLEDHLNEVLATIAAMQHNADVLQAKIEHYRSLEAEQASASPSEEGVSDEHGKPL
ncbi:MerR family transcriptional regulator [Aeromonas veronii]|uniref:MerR family transcriptional regulator n=1 Tax=Aeromonas veronii TaxID=654 RepID=UPI0035BA0218